MASERLTISEKDRIAKSIIKPIVEQSRKEFEDFGRFADEFFKKNLPKDVIEFMDKYPNVVKTKECIYLVSFTRERIYNIVSYIEVNYFVYSFITDAKFEELKNSTETKIFVQKMVELEKKASSIMNRTKCALEDINTTKQLKDNFPEAYNILMGFPKENVKGNKCDDIEKLRAELSKL
jgi:hypothetical protein